MDLFSKKCDGKTCCGNIISAYILCDSHKTTRYTSMVAHGERMQSYYYLSIYWHLLEHHFSASPCDYVSFILLYFVNFSERFV